MDDVAIGVEYLMLRQMHPRWALSEFKAMSPRERKYWKAAGEYMLERKLSLIEAGKELLEAP